MSRRVELEAELKQCQKELHDLDVSQNIEKNKPLLGKYFKLADRFVTFDDDEGERRWHIYQHATTLSEEGWLCGSRFETNPDGVVSMEPDVTFYSQVGEEITLEEYNKALEEFKAVIASL